MANENRSLEKEAFWRLAIEEFHRSGLTVRSYCRQEGLSEPSFYAWRRTLQQRDGAELDVARDRPALVPVEVVKGGDDGCIPMPALPPVEVLTPGGFTLRFPREIEPHQLASFWGVLSREGAASC